MKQTFLQITHPCVDLVLIYTYIYMVHLHDLDKIVPDCFNKSVAGLCRARNSSKKVSNIWLFCLGRQKETKRSGHQVSYCWHFVRINHSTGWPNCARKVGIKLKFIYMYKKCIVYVPKSKGCRHGAISKTSYYGRLINQVSCQVKVIDSCWRSKLFLYRYFFICLHLHLFVHIRREMYPR